MFLGVPKNGQFLEKKKSLKILDTLFARLRFFFKWLMYMFEKTKEAIICKTILKNNFGAWGFLLIDKKCI